MKHVVLPLLLVAVLAVLGAQAAVSARSSKMQLVVHLARTHSEAEIEGEFVSRSTPGSADFRKFLSQAQLADLVQGTPAAIEAVTYFLTKRGASNVRLSTTRDVISCRITPELAAELGHTGSRDLGRFALAVPAELSAHARFVVLNAAKGKKVRNARFAGASQPGSEQTPVTINARYNVPSSIAAPPGSYAQGVAEFEGEYFQQSDMNAFVAE